MALILSCYFWCVHLGEVTGDWTSCVTTNFKFLKPVQNKALRAQISARNKEVVWSTDTVKLAFQIRFLTVVRGYEFVL